jgi:PAS domain S-box-containing protein
MPSLSAVTDDVKCQAAIRGVVAGRTPGPDRWLPHRTASDAREKAVGTPAQLPLARLLQQSAAPRLRAAGAARMTRKEAFEKILRSVDEYALILLDDEGRITAMSTGAERIFGYSAAEASGQGFGIIFTPEDQQRKVPARELEKARATGRATDIRWHARKDGTRVWMEGNTIRLEGDGEAPAFLKIGRDATADRELSEQLAREQERYQLLVESAETMGIFMLDATGRVVSWNIGAERIKGYRPGEILGKPYSTFFPPEEQAAGLPEALLERAAAEGRVTEKGERLRKDGTRFIAHVTLTALRDEEGGLRGFSKVTRDITAQVRGEEERQRLLEVEQRARAELENLNERLERRTQEEIEFRHLSSALTGATDMGDVLLEITSRGIGVTRADGAYVERIVNPRADVEVVANSGSGTPERGTRVPYPGSLTEELLEGRNAVILADLSGFGAAMAPYLTKSCGECEVLVVPLIADDEELGALVLLNSRVSGRQFHEDDVEKARTLGDLASLALRRVRMIEQEKEARHLAEQAVRTRDELMGIVSHDLRNPLTRISLSVQLLESEGLPEPAAGELAQMVRAVDEMKRLIEDLLDSVRIEAGNFTIRRTWVPAAAVVEDAAESHRQLAAAKRQELKIDVRGDLPEICADHPRLLQVFSNLLGNAIKFTPEGGIITLNAEVADGSLLFAVADTGPGINEAEIGNVFEPYWQSKKTAHLGAGLGLSVARGIIEAHGGGIRVENIPGEGARFSFTLPLQSGSPPNGSE